jgi:hypothetical protein
LDGRFNKSLEAKNLQELQVYRNSFIFHKKIFALNLNVLALDPAKPLFDMLHTNYTTDQEDATFVDVIHTSGGCQFNKVDDKINIVTRSLTYNDFDS